MASNSFGKHFKITTWGESHGPAIGVVIDGCPSGLEITEEEINQELKKRRPHQNEFTSPRKEKDQAKILSGVFENKTTGAPICIMIENTDIDSSSYDEIKDLYRPSHANFTYLHKYGLFDHRGGGRASARETACRVAAGAIAKKLLKLSNIEVLAYVNSIGEITIPSSKEAQIIKKTLLKKNSLEDLKNLKEKSSLYCPDNFSEQKMLKLLTQIKEEKDSVGGEVKLISTNLPIGLGDPIFEKLSANLAKAFFSIPACIGMQIGNGFAATKLKGSQNNDPFTLKDQQIQTKTNNCGGILAGISTGSFLDISLAFKPTPSIQKPQETFDTSLNSKTLEMKNFRHDLCVAIRACSVVEAMASLVLIDAFLAQKTISL